MRGVGWEFWRFDLNCVARVSFVVVFIVVKKISVYGFRDLVDFEGYYVWFVVVSNIDCVKGSKWGLKYLK